MSLSAARGSWIHIKQAEFETLIRHHIDKTKALTEEALQAAKLQWRDIDKVLLVGGSTCIPMVREMVRKTEQEPETGINPDEVVALGAAVYEADLSGRSRRAAQGELANPFLTAMGFRYPDFFRQLGHCLNRGKTRADNYDTLQRVTRGCVTSILPRQGSSRCCSTER